MRVSLIEVAVALVAFCVTFTLGLAVLERLG